jgi:hypothetical protein
MGTRGRYVCRLHVRRDWGPDHGLLTGRKEKDGGVAVLEPDSTGAGAGAGLHWCCLALLLGRVLNSWVSRKHTKRGCGAVFAHWLWLPPLFTTNNASKLTANDQTRKDEQGSSGTVTSIIDDWLCRSHQGLLLISLKRQLQAPISPCQFRTYKMKISFSLFGLMYKITKRFRLWQPYLQAMKIKRCCERIFERVN